MKLFIEILLFIGFVSEFVLGLFVYLKGKNKLANKYFCGLLMSGALWNLFLVLGIIFTNQFLDKVAMIWGLFVSTFFLLFSKAFSKQGKSSISFLLLVLFFPILLSPFVLFTDIIIGRTVFHPNGFIESRDGPIVIVFYVFHIFYTLISFYYLIKGYRFVTGIKKIQFQYLLIGLSFLLFWFFITNIILPIFGIYHFISLSALCFIVLALFFLYIISRYRFMDIKIILKKGTIIFFVSIFSLIIYSLLIIALNYLLKYFLPLTEIAVLIITAILASLGAIPVYNLVKKQLNQYWQKQRDLISPKIPQIVKSIGESKKELNRFLGDFSRNIKKALKVKEVYFFLREKEPYCELFYPKVKTDFLLKKLLVKMEHPLIKYFQTTKDVIILDEIPYIREQPVSYLSAKAWNKVTSLLKHYGFSLCAPIFYEEKIIGVVFLSNRTDKKPFTTDEVSELKNSIQKACSYIWSCLMYIWALIRTEKIAQGRIDEVISYGKIEK